MLLKYRRIQYSKSIFLEYKRKDVVKKFMQKHGIMLLIILGILGLSIGYSAFNQNLTISGEAKVEKQVVYKEPILNGADPILQDDLVPVVIEDDGTVRKARIYEEWYNYEKQEWANAVILKDEEVTYYSNDIIPEENIESYFVWIPRFKYKIFDEGNYSSLTETENAEQTIEIIFEDRNTLVSNGSKVGEWLTHPAFTSFNSNGMWVGKFETGTTLTSDYNVRNGNVVQIKPNIKSWGNINVANAFYTSYDYKRNLDSHMMKNTEWGAVAYLQHSIYGSNKKVRFNNNFDYITGYSSINEPTCGYTSPNRDCNRNCNDGSCNSPYNTSIGYLASTTANISGIYDMSGGAWEYVISFMQSENGKIIVGQSETSTSGFIGIYGQDNLENTVGLSLPNNKYYDLYPYITKNRAYFHRILGDATGEMGPFASHTYYDYSREVSSWHENRISFINNTVPIFLRGGSYADGSYSGIFASNRDTGRLAVNMSFRIVLTPNNA